MIPKSATGRWTSRSGKLWVQIVADAIKPPETHYNDLPFRPLRDPPADHSLLKPPAIAPAPAPVAAVPASSPPRKPLLMRGLQRLANLAPTIMASLDTKADKIADELVSQQARAEGVIDQFGALATTLGKVADDVSAALGQITNDPTQVSGG